MVLVYRIGLMLGLVLANVIASGSSLSAHPVQTKSIKSSILSEETEKHRKKGPRQHARWGHRYAHQR